MSLPILTLPDPVTSGEGAIDPLGLATVGDHLADLILPGLRARMSRPRFLTAIAACAAVCDGIEDRVAADGVTPAYIVFEWLLVEAFARAAARQDTPATPGILKALDARRTREPMRASAYLRIPTIFGYHGVYKPLARSVGIVDEDMRLGEQGYPLLKVWQTEQGLDTFVVTALGDGPGKAVREALRSAVEDALKASCTTRSDAWRGWSHLAQHLVPAKVGLREAAFLHRLLVQGDSGTRGEVIGIIERASLPDEVSEAEVVSDVLIPKASPTLKPRLRAIAAYEAMCTLVEDAFDWIRYLSARAGARAISAGDFAARVDAQRIVSALPDAVRRAEDGLSTCPLPTQQEFALIARAFGDVHNPRDLFEAVLSHHHDVQQAKKPDGKRDWFERDGNGATVVRIPYRVHEPPEARTWWSRPYRINTVHSFLADLKVGAYEPA